MKRILKQFLSAKTLVRLKYYRGKLLSRNNIKGLKGNILEKDNSCMENCIIEFHGTGNKILMGGGNILCDCELRIFGSNNLIQIGLSNYIKGATLWIEDCESVISIGNRNKFCGKIQLASVEGCSLIIGDDNLFSSEINITTTDSHSILDVKTGMRINHSKSVYIGNHNWIGMRSIILKGCDMGQDNIVAAGAVVAKSPGEHNSIIGGNPAKIIKRGVSWDEERKKVD